MPQGYISVTVGRSRVNGFVTDPVTMAYHELRAPLALMVTAARSAADDCGDDDLRARCLSIVRTAERMLRTAGEVMTVAECAKDDSTSTFAPGEVVERVVADLRGMNAPVSFDGPIQRSMEVEAAAGQLEALLCSTIGNALDHGALETPVHIRMLETGSSVVIEIRNTISRPRTHRGLGLGTYIGDKLARGLGATLDLTRTDQEFCARISLPARARSFALAV
jgi:signal transduction histidine kinase